jgi:amino acid transporter
MAQNDSPSPRPDLPRKVGFWGAIAITVGVVIGSGIFAQPSVIATHLASPTLILVMWLVGGLLALCGALTFAELATRYPASGGLYVFLREGFGPVPAFVFGWTYMLIAKPAAAGGIAIFFATTFADATGLRWNPALLTCAVLLLLTIINVIGVKASTGVSLVLSATKYLALIAIVALSIGVIIKNAIAPGSTAAGGWNSATTTESLFKAIIPVMAAIMWTYDGWADVGAIAGEVQEPRKNLPRIYILGTLSIIAIYMLVNFCYLWFVPIEQMRKGNVAPQLIERLVGAGGAIFVSAMIIVSTVGSSHASVMTGARVTFAQSRDGLLFSFLGKVDPRFETPAIALWVQLAFSCLIVLFLQDFAKLAGSFVFTMWIFYGLAGASLLIIRKRQGPPAPDQYRTPMYPLVPIVFVLASIAMTVLSIIDDPLTTGMWIAVLLAGVPVYFVWRRLYPAAS